MEKTLAKLHAKKERLDHGLIVDRPRRRLSRWRFSVHTDVARGSDGLALREDSAESDKAGTTLAGSATDALEAVALDEGCHRVPTSFHYWRSGGWATFANDEGATVTVLVVATD